MADQVWVITLEVHYDRRACRNRHPSPYAFELDFVEATRRARRGLVRILERSEVQAYLAPKAVTARETKPAYPTADKQQMAKDFSSFIRRRGSTSWYDVDGHDKSVNGRTNAIKVAEALHSESRRD